MLSALLLPFAYSPARVTPPIIGGQGDFTYQYDAGKLQPPPGASIVNAHGLVTDAAGNIILAYENDGKSDFNCLIRWAPDGTGAEFLTGGGRALCDGTPHGLTVASENGTEFLYHANNDQKLTKTTLDGTIVWQRTGNFGQDPSLPYRPTWFAVPPASRYIYLCDGYGSNNVYPFDRYTGAWARVTYGGKGGMTEHGKFSTNHGCTYDPRAGMIAVSDRANHRLEYLRFDPALPDGLAYDHTVDMRPGMGGATLPCNLRAYPAQEGRAISPALDGPVAVLDAHDAVVSVVNVSVLLAAEQHKHPHDAIFLANGDMAVATWAPGRLSYWMRLHPPAAPLR